MSRLLRALRALGVDEENISDAYDDDFLTDLQTEAQQPAIRRDSVYLRSEQQISDGYNVEAPLLIGDLTGQQKLDFFKKTVGKLPLELKIKILRLCFSKFYETDMLGFLQDSSLLSVLKVFYDELLICDGKLYFGGFNEYDVIEFSSAEFQDQFKPLIKDSQIRIKILKIFDTNGMGNEDLLLLLNHAETIWCASASSLSTIYSLCPDALSKITDLSVENLDFPIPRADLVKIFGKLCRSLKDFTLPLSPDDSENVTVMLDSLNAVDHQLTVHLPISYPLDGGRGLDHITELLVPYSCKIKLSHILFTLVCPNFHFNDLHNFLKKVGFKKFTDFCLVSFPNFRVQGDLKFVSELSNLVTIVLSGGFTLNSRKFGDLKGLKKLKELMLENCKLDSEWFNKSLPENLKDITISYNSFSGYGTYTIPRNLKILTILANDYFNMKLDNVDFSQSNLSVLKFRVDDQSQWNSLTVSFANIPRTLQEVNCHKLTSFIVEKDINLSRKKDLLISITTTERERLLDTLDPSNVRSNVDVRFGYFENEEFHVLGEANKMKSIGGFPNRLLKY